MSESKNFRISLDLSRFFCDHRRVARVFVKGLKTIQDLHDRISQIFDIHGFFLSTDGHFLPVSEDIRIIHNDEIVCITPDESSANNRKPKTKGHSSTENIVVKNIQLKRRLENIAEESPETYSPKKKKSRKQPITEKSSSSSSSEDEEACKKNNVKQDYSPNENNDTLETAKRISGRKDNVNSKYSCFLKDPIPSSKNEKNNQNKKQSIVEKEICSIETANKLSEIKKKLKQRSDEYIQKHSSNTPEKFTEESVGYKTVLPKLQSHIKNCNSFGRSSLPDTVRLSRHVDTPIKTFTKYKPPQRITDQYLAKNKVNIVKIDVIRGSTEKSNADIVDAGKKKENEVLQENPNSPPENLVKTLVNSFENNISSNDIAVCALNESKEIDETEASNYTKIFLDQKVANAVPVPEIRTETSPTTGELDKSLDCSNPHNGLEKEQSSPTRGELDKSLDCSNPHSGLEKEQSVIDVSLDSSSLPQDNLTLQEISCNSTLNLSTVSTDSNSTPFVTSRKPSSIKLDSTSLGALVECLKESDSMFSQESDTSSQYATKRKRIRKRKRKIKNDQSAHEIEAKPIKIPKPMKTVACPKMHIKFDENNEETTEEKSDLIQDYSLEKLNVGREESVQVIQVDNSKTENNGDFSSSIEVMIVSDENDDPIMENKSIFGSDNISKAPLMGNQLEPKVGDIIAFKVLKMTEAYTPQLSNYIVGKVEIYLLENKTIYFKILSGAEELLPPRGKLSLDLTEKDTPTFKYKELNWNEILEPKLLYP